MASICSQESSRDGINGGKGKKKIGRPKASQNKTRPTSRSGSNSKNSSPYMSPNKFISLGNEDSDEEEIWTCEMCSRRFEDPNAKLLECQRCKGHFCIACLNKSEEVYQLLADSDLMWFCCDCRERVEKNIVTDVEIERRCKMFMQDFEDRIAKVESEIQSKCNVDEVKNIIKEEMDRREASGKSEGIGGGGQSVAENSDLTQVMSEINERKQRELNIVIHGVEECFSDSKEERIDHDRQHLLQVLGTCDRAVRGEDLGKVIRIGRFNRDKPKRPLLVTVKTNEVKRKIFKGAGNLKSSGKYKEVKVANDLTKAEREQERVLFNKAKELEKEQGSGDYLFRVRGPPWARKVVKVRKEEN